MSFLSRHVRVLHSIPKLVLSKRFQQTKPKLSVSGDVIPVFSNAQLFPDKIALKDSIGSYTYANIFISAKELAAEISRQVEGKNNQRVLFMCSNDADYLITLWAIWMSGQIAVPLSAQHPKNLLLYYANDTDANLLISTTKYADLMQRVASNTNTKLHILDDKQKLNSLLKVATKPSDMEGPLSLSFYSKNNALILYTSGTTGNPKGVVITHKSVVFQMNTLLDAWKWSPNDVILHTLPLYHIHGLVNALLCPLYIGAKVVLLPKFNANSVWSHLLGFEAKNNDKKISVYMAVPTIYSLLIDEYEKVFGDDPKMVEYIRNTLKSKIRLMVSGSAPLTNPVYEKWLAISGQRLLERYGMTEIGMCLSNLYDSNREPGFVGLPLPGVSIQLAENSGNKYSPLLECSNIGGQFTYKTTERHDVSGELLVKSDGVFKEYFKRPDATRKEFTPTGWFKTGDVASYSFDKRAFQILGRNSTDIIKTGGFKVGALQVEAALLAHADIKDCAVVGLDDEKWGQRIAAVIVLNKKKEFDIEGLKEWAREKLPKYAIPSEVRVVEEIPKNAVGKVNKKELVKIVFNVVK